MYIIPVILHLIRAGFETFITSARQQRMIPQQIHHPNDVTTCGHDQIPPNMVHYTPYLSLSIYIYAYI